MGVIITIMAPSALTYKICCSIVLALLEGDQVKAGLVASPLVHEWQLVQEAWNDYGIINSGQMGYYW